MREELPICARLRVRARGVSSQVDGKSLSEDAEAARLIIAGLVDSMTWLFSADKINMSDAILHVQVALHSARSA